MKTTRLNWAYIIIGVVGLLMASCATDDNDFGSDVRNSDYMYNGVSNMPTGAYEGVWFAIDNDKEPISTATLTVRKDGSLSLSSIPCDSIINYYAETYLRRYTLNVPEWSDLEERFKRTATSSIVSSVSFSMVNTANSVNSYYYELTDESMTFPMRGEFMDNEVCEKMTVWFEPRKSIAVYDITDKQWGVFLYYSKVLFHGYMELPLDLGYKFISTKRLE